MLSPFLVNCAILEKIETMAFRKPIKSKQLAVYKTKIKPLIPGFEALTEHVVITNADANILYMNKAAERTTGYTLKEVMGKNPGDFWGGHMADKFYQGMWSMIKTEKRPFMGEVQNTTKNGKKYWQELIISPVPDETDQIKFFIAIEPNITQRKTAQVLIETLNQAIAGAKNFPQAMHQAAKLICQYAGWDLVEAWIVDQTQKTLQLDFSWGPRPKKVSALVQARKKMTLQVDQGLTKKTWLKDVPIQASEAGLNTALILPVHINNTTVAVFVFFMPQVQKIDLQTARFIQKIIEKLKFSFQQKFLEGNINMLRQSVESSKDAILVAAKDGSILYVNPAWEELIGTPKTSALGEKVQVAWDHGVPQDFFERMWETVVMQQKPFNQEVAIVAKDKADRWQEIHVSPIKDENGKTKFLIAVASDTTKRKAKDKFREEFISIIGHQLKNPLTSTRWTLELLLDQKKNNPSEKKDLEVLYDQNKRVLNLVGDLLILSRVEKASINLEKIDLVQEIKTILAVAKANHPSMTFTFQPSDSVEITSNKTLAVQVFYNIIMNAADYSNQKTGHVDLQLNVKDKQGSFVCQDNGIGIPKKEQSKVFAHFFRGSNAEKYKEGGTGLGLFIVKLITESLGWKVNFHSIQSKGTTFTVSFPVP